MNFAQKSPIDASREACTVFDGTRAPKGASSLLAGRTQAGACVLPGPTFPSAQTCSSSGAKISSQPVADEGILCWISSVCRSLILL